MEYVRFQNRANQDTDTVGVHFPAWRMLCRRVLLSAWSSEPYIWFTSYFYSRAPEHPAAWEILTEDNLRPPECKGGEKNGSQRKNQNQDQGL